MLKHRYAVNTVCVEKFGSRSMMEDLEDVLNWKQGDRFGSPCRGEMK